MSASRMPALSPMACRPSARLTAVVDLPTPPLPEATAIMCLMPATWHLPTAARLQAGGAQEPAPVARLPLRSARLLDALALSGSLCTATAPPPAAAGPTAASRPSAPP